MKDDMVATYASILHEEKAVTFEENECIYRIWESSQGGWYIEVLTEADSGQWTEDDGGLCTGNAKDAVEFMLTTPQFQAMVERQDAIKHKVLSMWNNMPYVRRMVLLHELQWNHQEAVREEFQFLLEIAKILDPAYGEQS